MAEAAETTTETTTDTAATTETATAAAATAAATTTEVKADWPQDWRTKLSPDEKHAKQLATFASPQALFDSYNVLRQKLSSGELKSNLPDKATPEQLAAWRAENGIPENPEGYGIEAKDNPTIPGFLKFAHEKNMHPALVKDLLDYNKQEVERQKEVREQESAQLRQETEDTLRKEWGEDYRRNTNLLTQLLDSTAADADLKTDILETVKMNAGLARWLMQISNIHNPVATILPAGNNNPAGAIDDEISSIEKLMGDHSSDYWRGPKAEKMQSRYKELITARDTLKKR